MPILAKYVKQPADTQDYDIDFAEQYLTALGDTAVSHTVVADPGITVVTSSITLGVVKVWLSGGVSGNKYKITVTITTASTPARVKQAEILIYVKEV